MGEMRCEDVRRVLPAHLDGEPHGADRGALDAHLAGCAACEREARGHRNLLRALASLPSRRVSQEFDARLKSALATQAVALAPRAWWEHFRFQASWRLLPALTAAAGVAAGLAAWALLPGTSPPATVSSGDSEVVRQYQTIVQMHHDRDANPDREVVDYSIAQSTQGSAFDAN